MHWKASRVSEFKLTDPFVSAYEGRTPPFGFRDAGGNSIGELVFARTYSRLKPNGSKERWHEVCRRVVEGMYELQRRHIVENRLPWSPQKAQASAQEAYERLFEMKWMPPGRGLWMMGTPLVMERGDSSGLQNCAAVSFAEMDRRNPADPFCWLMEASMLGIGVGFSTVELPHWLTVMPPTENKPWVYTIPDSREGWVESVRFVLNHFLHGDCLPVFDYSGIRPAGARIATFGGTAAGPEPLQRLHTELFKLLAARPGPVDSMLVGDICNLIGLCVVSGNVRRSAELWLGSLDDVRFLSAKDYGLNPDRAEWGWMSNNSVVVSVGDDLSAVVEGIARNGEPGVVWMDALRSYGRMADAPDKRDTRVAGVNPCAEMQLESYECCTLAETFLGRHDSLDDYLRTLKFAYLYAKTVTLLPTRWFKTNAVMQRNRRIGISMSGVADFGDERGLPELRLWMNKGYHEVRRYDRSYSEWLCVRESVRTTTVKPSGTVSLLAGSSPGVHWSPAGRYFLRGVVFSTGDPLVPLLAAAGYTVQPSAYTPETSVFVQFPVQSSSTRGADEVSLFEKANIAAEAQYAWSDNAVSVTLSFDPATEARHVATVLQMYEGRLKTVSFLPSSGHGYEQAPYQPLTAAEYEACVGTLREVDLSALYDSGVEAVGEAYCTTDVCELKPA